MERQLQVHRQIVRFLDNFRKIGRNNYTPAVVRTRITSLKELWVRFNDEHAILERTVSEATKMSVSYFAENVYDKTEDVYNSTLDHLAEVLEEVEPLPSPNRSLEISHSRASQSAFTLSRLPAIQLPPYDGSELEWESFRDRFVAVILENKELSDFSRMHYLVSSLRGRALECISGLQISAENFGVAWQALKDRFDNKRRLISVHLSNLLDLPRLTRESANDLQSLHGRVRMAVASLGNLQRTAADLWNDFLVHIILRHVDHATRRAWTLRSSGGDQPHAYDELDRFLSERVRALEDVSRDAGRASTARGSGALRVHSANTASQSGSACPICSSRHYFSSCPRFLNGTPISRRDLVQRHRRCFNCLSPKHAVRDCTSRFSCRMCQQKHHSSLHDPSGSEHTNKPGVAAARNHGPTDGPGAEANSLVVAKQATHRARVLLATARVRVLCDNGRSAVVRALLDQGSEVTLASERLVQLLKARRIRASTLIRGVGCSSAGTVRCAVDLRIASANSSSASYSVVAMVLGALTAYASRQVIDLNQYDHLSGLTWADPSPGSNEPIDLIIGADLYADILLDGLRKGSLGQPVAQLTAFGWVISGAIGRSAMTKRQSTLSDATLDVASSLHCLESLDRDLKRFWEVEDVPQSSLHTPDDERCEAHFASTHSRAASGRYRVRIPFRASGAIDIGSSRGRAEQCLQSLFRRFHNRTVHQPTYADFLREYLSLGHMRRVTDASARRDPVVYIPHHPVLRAHCATSSLRVVFNASSRTTNGTSLNDHILSGPKLQSNLSAVILRWRAFRFVYCADIAKMYRQIWVDERDVDFQRIIWSESQLEQPAEFQLLTITYGMTCAPFLAMRVLQQLREDEGHAYPLASQILSTNIYVDDILFGGDSIAETMVARDQLVSLLGKGCFPLRKWSGNSLALLADIADEDKGITGSKSLAEDERIRVLGINWKPREDAFSFHVDLPMQTPRSKRAILSTISRLYDPLGWVTPATIAAKILLQSLWRRKLGWDEPIPDDLFSRWQRMCRGFSRLNDLRLTRWIGMGSAVKHVELHGFADASNSAYAAVVYCRVVSVTNSVTVSLLTGKSRVAPLKPLSVPRLELCAAVVLTRLLEFVRSSLPLDVSACYCWSDSTVVLTWLSQHPSRWKVFVAHRVHDVQTRVPNANWRYVPTADNPADCASRGLLGCQLLTHALWWNGPPWLAKPAEEWPTSASIADDRAESEQRVVSLHAETSTPPWDLLTRYSSWPKLIRVLAYMLKFISACRRRLRSTNATCELGLALTFELVSAARLIALRMLQQALFPDELKRLSNHQTLSPKNPIQSLSPFLDQHGILRVGGRISRSPLPHSCRHPILLASHSLTDLIIDQAHVRALHAGIQLTLSILRRDFWLLRARSVVRHRIHMCVACARERASAITQIMSDLPTNRVSAPPRAFTHTGIDYAGPVQIRHSSGRGIPSRKAYIALFVCLATKAIHLELVSDYSTKTFLNAFSRFSARRGLPQTIYSDNGTTFVGADRELVAAFRSAIRDPTFLNHIATDRVEWKFNPPSAPHFGGLWEAGVKSVKHHFRRIVKNRTLTSEEMGTLLCRIEACLNSRPIAPLSDNIDDFDPLTPGHFLIGAPITTHPEPSVLDVNENRLTRWQLVRHMTERFWHHWYYEYVNLLQQKGKWRQARPPLKVGQLVLVRSPNVPPCKWDLGRVTRCHPGADGQIRVATVKTATSEVIRPIVKLCALPVNCVQRNDASAAPDNQC